jgi:hypothetical protein
VKSQSLAWSVVPLFALGACASVKPGATTGSDAGSTGTGGGNGGGTGGVSSTDAGSGTGGTPLPTSCAPTCTDFPADPIIVSGAPTDAPTMFGAPGGDSAGAGPCLSDPQDGTLFPGNWLRPRFAFTGGVGQNLFELRLHSDSEKNDLVVYTTTSPWAMPKDMWQALGRNVINKPITVTVRSLATAGANKTVSASAPSSFTIAPVGVNGSIVYWTTSMTSGGLSALKGFKVGDETVSTVMTPAMVDPTVQCIGCHVSTPDGAFIGMAVNKAPDHADPASLAIRSGTTGQEPAFLSASARMLLSRPVQQVAAFSGGHWALGDHVGLSMYQDRDIIWTDLEATSMAQDTAWGVIARTGDTGTPVSPTWSHDGMTVAYTSVKNGTTDTGLRVLSGLGSLYTVPYGARKGGAATVLKGGDDPSFHAYYPAFSPDDHYLAFTRAPSSGISYDIPAAEVFLLPREGATTPTRLAANDPPKCSNRTSPGVTNSWPKWAPTVGLSSGTSYYWLTFSSRRLNGSPQIFITALTVTETGLVNTYPALYVWNQPATESNHTPAWDVFQISVQ